jgi:hypothetical protein
MSGRRRQSAAALLAAVIAAGALCAAVPAAARSGPAFCSLAGAGGLVDVSTAELQTRGVLALAIGARYYESRDLTDALGADVAGRYVGLHLNASYGLTPWLELDADVPFRRAAWRIDGATVSGEVLDSPKLSVKLAPPRSSSFLSFALQAGALFPVDGELTVSAPGASGARYVTGGERGWEAVALVTADLTDRLPLRVHANAGYASHGSNDRGLRFFPDEYPAVRSGGSSTDNDALILRAAIEFPGRSVDLFTEFRGDLLRDRDLVALKENPLTITPGIRARLGDRWAATIALSVGMSGNSRATPDFDPLDAYPDWVLSASVSYAWPVRASDTDGDGIPDVSDRCPTAAEDADGYQDADGCPDPDNDGDGIPDAIDGAPDLAEDIDGYEDLDGIPDLDNDGDGIVDARDMCPDEPEDLDGFEDQDGCPDQ